MTPIASRSARRWLTLALLFASLQAAASGLQDENLLQGLPEGFQMGHRIHRPDLTMYEWVPLGESVQDWTQMVTTQIFQSSPMGLSDYFGDMNGAWTNSCPGAEATQIREGEENGYRFALWLYRCPLNRATGKPETTWIKGIRGRDALYAVQWAFRSEPDEAGIRRSISYLRAIAVCDTRVENSPCPDLRPVATEPADSP